MPRPALRWHGPAGGAVRRRRRAGHRRRTCRRGRRSRGSTGTTRSNSRLIAATTSSAGVFSANGVKSRMSRNMTVTSTSSPARFVPSSRMCSATSGSTYAPNVSRIFSRSASPSTIAIESELQLPDLGAVVDRDPDVELAAADAFERVADRVDRICGGTRGERDRLQADDDPDAAEHGHRDPEPMDRGARIVASARGCRSATSPNSGNPVPPSPREHRAGGARRERRAAPERRARARAPRRAGATVR